MKHITDKFISQTCKDTLDMILAKKLWMDL